MTKGTGQIVKGQQYNATKLFDVIFKNDNRAPSPWS